MRNLIAEVLMLAGVAGVVVGVWRLSSAAGLAVCGLLLFVLGAHFVVPSPPRQSGG